MLTVGEVQQLERDRYDAMRKHDVERLTELLGPELVYTHSNAESDNKRDYLRKVGDGTFVYHAITVSDETIKIVGETALVYVRMTADITVGGANRAVDNRALAVWVNTSEGCKLVAYQPTVIPKS